jgi:hypothetical protein
MLAVRMHATLDRLYRTIEDGVRVHDPSTLWRRPEGGAGRWSGQQIVEHLLLTYSLSAANFEARLRKGTPTSARPSPGQRLGQFFVCTLGVFPRGRKSPAAAEPASEFEPLTGAQLMERVEAGLRRFDQVADEGERRFGAQLAFTHPVLGPMNAVGWRRFHLAHGLHHMKQVRALRGHGS